MASIGDRHKRDSGISSMTSANGDIDSFMSSIGTERSAPATPTKFANLNSDMKLMRHLSNGSNRSDNASADGTIESLNGRSQNQNISGPCKHPRLAPLELLDPPSGAPQTVPDS